MPEELVEIYGARVHNLKNIDVTFPRNKLVVVTGLSGSGKSSLAFDTLYAEGQRRYIETFSAYARQFLGTLERPDVDKISGLSPVISIEQKTTSKNPRSTVGTITEIYDFLRLLYARIGEAYSYNTGEKMVKFSHDQIVNNISEKLDEKKIIILAPVVKGRKGHYRELFDRYRKKGFLKARIDGKITDLLEDMQIERFKTHDIEIVIDKLHVNESAHTRISQSTDLALKMGNGSMIVLEVEDKKDPTLHSYSKYLMCPTTGIAYDEPAPNCFSFNSPYGACPKCNGLGIIKEVNVGALIPDKKLSIAKGGLAPLNTIKTPLLQRQIEAIGKLNDFDLDTPLSKISDEAMEIIFYGTDEAMEVPFDFDGNG
ncbi:MAG: excinuclease ABC subunit UvrA, partial [Bacteroidia bacterium]|nr:excinuclease ABC subunit UvrA [Bacteroidia bacterium]